MNVQQRTFFRASDSPLSSWACDATMTLCTDATMASSCVALCAFHEAWEEASTKLSEVCEVAILSQKLAKDRANFSLHPILSSWPGSEVWHEVETIVATGWNLPRVIISQIMPRMPATASQRTPWRWDGVVGGRKAGAKQQSTLNTRYKISPRHFHLEWESRNLFWKYICFCLWLKLGKKLYNQLAHFCYLTHPQTGGAVKVNLNILRFKYIYLRRKKPFVLMAVGGIVESTMTHPLGVWHTTIWHSSNDSYLLILDFFNWEKKRRCSYSNGNVGHMIHTR